MPSPSGTARPTLTPEQLSQRARIGARARHSPDAPELAEDRREFRASRLEQHIRDVVDQSPPFTLEQRDRLAALLWAPSAAPSPPATPSRPRSRAAAAENVSDVDAPASGGDAA